VRMIQQVQLRPHGAKQSRTSGRRSAAIGIVLWPLMRARAPAAVSQRRSQPTRRWPAEGRGGASSAKKRKGPYITLFSIARTTRPMNLHIPDFQNPSFLVIGGARGSAI
jgi:hypothetical protein